MSRERREPGERASQVIPLVVALLTFVAFLPVLHADFVTWDDDRNFLDNPNYRGLGPTQLRWMWTTFHLGHYIPLSWMTLGLDYRLWGMNAAGYHLSNLLLHTGNAVLVYFIARRLFRLTGAFGPATNPLSISVPAGFAALLFAIHPLRVESVAWVTERRDVLSGLFYFSTILFYLRSREEGQNRRRWYWLAVVAFVCALLSKGSAVTLPAVFLILNVYPLKRLGGHAGWWTAQGRQVYVEVAPFALLAAATSALSVVALHPPEQLSAAGKVAVSGYSLIFYLWKTILPLHLAPLYEMPQTVNPTAVVFLAAYVAVVALATLVFVLRRRWPAVTAASLVFFITILPLLGIIQNGPQIAADRYTYLAAPALAILAAGAVSLLKRSWATAPAGVGAGILFGLGALTWNQSQIWHDSERLWSRVLSVDSQSSIGHVALGSLRIRQNRLEEGIDHYERALAIDPDYAEGYNNLGVALARQQRFADATENFRRALAYRPTYDEAHNNWGVAEAQQGNYPQAIDHYRRALAINPHYADAHANWGNALARLGRADEAIAHYQEALVIRPDHADAQLNWGVVLAQRGKLSEAVEHFRQALAINPKLAEAREYLERATQLQQRQSSLNGSR